MTVIDAVYNRNIFFIFREDGTEIKVHLVKDKIDCDQKLKHSENEYFKELILKRKVNKIKV